MTRIVSARFLWHASVPERPVPQSARLAQCWSRFLCQEAVQGSCITPPPLTRKKTAQACYPSFLGGSWGVFEVILFFLLFGGALSTLRALCSDVLWLGWGEFLCNDLRTLFFGIAWVVMLPMAHPGTVLVRRPWSALWCCFFVLLFWEGRWVKSCRSSCANRNLTVLVVA